MQTESYFDDLDNWYVLKHCLYENIGKDHQKSSSSLILV